jgi:hypothetical protein
MEKDILVIKGEYKVLFSAPHIFAHPRKTFEGMSYRIAEPLTDVLMKDIVQRISAYGITLSSKTDYDPNYDKYYSNPYKHEVKELVKVEKINAFIDIHGLSNKHNFDLGIYYKNKYTNSKTLAFKLAKEVNTGRIRDILIKVALFKNNEQETLAEYACTKLDIPSVEIEVAWYLLEDEFLRNELSKNISEVIAKLF